jgi:hypothetical protein
MYSKFISTTKLLDCARIKCYLVMMFSKIDKHIIVCIISRSVNHCRICIWGAAKDACVTSSEEHLFLQSAARVVHLFKQL